MIASVSFRDFKALRSTSLPLVPFNLVIGANGSGKTSLIQALLRLRTLARRAPADVAPRSRRVGEARVTFRFNPPFAALEARLVCAPDIRGDRLQVRPARAKAWPALQTGLRRLRAYQLDHAALAEPSPAATRGAAPYLSANGSNLPAVLASLRDRQPAAFAALVAELRRILPEYAGVELRAGPKRGVALGLVLGKGGGVVPADSVSQGTLYLLALLTLAYQPDPPPLLAIEELDRGLHPRMLREVRDLLYRLSYPAACGWTRPAVQVIATTHSPYLLDLFRDHPEEIVIAQKRGQESRFERLVDRSDLAELLQEGSLGDMWYSGILGGVPEDQ